MKKYLYVYNISRLLTILLTAVVITVTTTLSAMATNTVPHGTYSGNSFLCFRCHKIHEAPEKNWQDTRKGTFLLKNSDEKAVCYTCHDGSGSTYNVKAELGDDMSGGTTKASAHPVYNGAIVCSGCHSPHKQIENFDTTHTPDEAVRLLRGNFGSYLGYVIDALNSAWSDKGAEPAFNFPAQQRLTNENDICGSCHGAASALPGGDHLSNFDGTPHDTATPAPPPPAVSKIKCLNCHEWHGSTLKPLLRTTIAGNPITGPDNSICYSCHIPAVGAFSGQTLFSTVKHATVTTSTIASVIWPSSTYQPGGCLNCHNPHGTASTNYRRAAENDLCSTCHEAGTLPAAYSFRGITAFNQTPHADTGNNYTKWPFPNETGAAVGLGGSMAGECINCHNPHGQDNGSGGYYPKLALRSEEALCYGGGTTKCHASVNGSVNGININQRFTANTNNRTHHNITAADQAAPDQGGTSKVECINCHDPHLNRQDAKNVDPDNRYALFSQTVNDVTLYPKDVIQPGPVPGKDAFLFGWDPITNYGTANLFWVGKVWGQPGRAILQFDLSSIPTTATITSASLFMPQSSGGTNPSPLAVNVYRNLTSWDESLVTYNTAPAMSASVSASATMDNSSAWRTWSITALAQNWLNGTFQNYGLTLMAPTAESGGSDWYREYYSSDQQINPPPAYGRAQRPKLEVQFTSTPPPQRRDYITFCGRCHDGTPPTSVTVPAGVRQIVPNYTNSAATGDFHGGRVSTGPFSGSGLPLSDELIGPYYFGIGALACVDCHDSHGSNNAYGLKESINGNDNLTVPLTIDSSNYSKVQKFCGSCHTFTHTPAYDCFSCHFHGANNDGSSSTFF